MLSRLIQDEKPLQDRDAQCIMSRRAQDWQVFACVDAQPCVHAALAADGSVLVVGAPEAGAGGRMVHIFNSENGQFVERGNVSAPASSAPVSRFGSR